VPPKLRKVKTASGGDYLIKCVTGDFYLVVFRVGPVVFDQ